MATSLIQIRFEIGTESAKLRRETTEKDFLLKISKFNSSLDSSLVLLQKNHSNFILVYFNHLLCTHRDATGKFPEYPDEDDGGSAAIFKQKDPAEVEAELAGKVNLYISYFLCGRHRIKGRKAVWKHCHKW